MVFGKPTFSGSWGLSENPGFGVDACEVSDIAGALPGCAVTVEHNALNTILDKVDANPQHMNGKFYKTELDLMNGDKRAVGSVIGAHKSEVTISIDPEFEGLLEVIGSGYLNGLSLTTVRGKNGKVDPLELTLTNTPARGPLAKLNFQYKEGRRSKLKSKMSDAQTPAPSTPAPAAEATPTAMEAAVASLSEDHRVAVIDRLQKYEDAIKEKDQLAATQKEQLNQLEQLTKAKEADRDLILAQFRTLQAAMAEAGASDAAKRLDGLDSMLQSENSALRDHATSQLVMACSAAFQGRAVAAPAAPAPAEPVAKRAKLGSGPDDLRNLLRSSF